MTEPNTSGVADIVPGKPAPRECKTSLELKAHYPTLDDYLAAVDAAELHHYRFVDSSIVGHAYYQKGFETIGEQFDTIVRAFAANARAEEREYIASKFGNGFDKTIRNLPPEQGNE